MLNYYHKNSGVNNANASSLLSEVASNSSSVDISGDNDLNDLNKIDELFGLGTASDTGNTQQ